MRIATAIFYDAFPFVLRLSVELKHAIVTTSIMFGFLLLFSVVAMHSNGMSIILWPVLPDDNYSFKLQISNSLYLVLVSNLHSY